jgi:hypothetical protein
MKKLTEGDALKILNIAMDQVKDNPYYRLGQAFFNILYEQHEDISNEIRGTEFDPFYNDKKIPKCIEYITGKL